MKLSYKDFNNMNDKELRALPGVGKLTARNIVGMRPYRSSEDLFKVRGLGKNTLKKLGIERRRKDVSVGLKLMECNTRTIHSLIMKLLV